MKRNENMNGYKPIKKILIIGGGSSGMMAASYLTRTLRGSVEISLVESKHLGRIGVGEATVPTIKTELFDLLGIPESEWMPKVQATFKLGIKYKNWKLSPAEGGDHYYHSFGEIPSVEGIPLSHLWHFQNQNGNLNQPMDYACYSTPTICDQYKSPIYLDGTKAVHYAYHLDAILMAEFLRDWSIERGLNHIYDDLTHASLDEEGNIAAVYGSGENVYEADLYIDCSGFAGFLIDKHLKEPKVSFSDSLITDSALAFQTPIDAAQDGIEPYTTATAMNNGWLWNTPLMERSGNGYVYSSNFTTPEEAEREVRAQLGAAMDGVSVRNIRFSSYRRRRSWVKNVVSLGLASSFLEPLESTGLYFTYAALYQLVENLSGTPTHPVIRDRFNRRVAQMVDGVKDFIIMHFCTSPRTDTTFWNANKHEIKVPDSLKELLELQRVGLPIQKSYLSNDMTYNAFEASFDRFWTNSNYQCILMGVDYLPETVMPLLNHRADLVEKSEEVFAAIRQQTQLFCNSLPTQYEYLTQQARAVIQI